MPRQVKPEADASNRGRQISKIKDSNSKTHKGIPENAFSKFSYSAPVSKSLPSNFCFRDVVLDFGLEENAKPVHADPMPPPTSSRVVKTRRLPTKYYGKEVLKPSVDDGFPSIPLEWLKDPNFRPISPIKKSFVDEYDCDLPSSENILKNYKALKDGSVHPSQAEWPLCCMIGQENCNTLPPKSVEPQMFNPSPSKNVEQKEVSPVDAILNWEVDEENHKDTREQRRFHGTNLHFGSRTIGVEEERAMNDWIKSEELQVSLSDIEEFDKLLSLAMDYEKNRDVLFDLLKPKSLTGKYVVDVRKEVPVIELLPRKSDVVETQLRKPSHDDPEPDEASAVFQDIEGPLENLQLTEQRPKKPIILDVQDIAPLSPKPADEAEVQDWLQQCSKTISMQLQSIINEERSNHPKPSTEPELIDFESEITKEQMKPRRPGEGNTASMESGWQSSFRVRLEDFEDIIDQNMTEYRDPFAKRLRSKWYQQYGFQSEENLKRSLMLPPLSGYLDKCLQKISIKRRPDNGKVEPLLLHIEFKFCKGFCTLNLNRNLHLKVAAKTLHNASYNRYKDVIQIEYEDTQVAWVWSNGTLMIINGRSENMLAETQKDLVAHLIGRMNFKAEASHKLWHLRLSSCAYYPWQISLPDFSAIHVLSPKPITKMHYVYYVDKELPGVAARVHKTGMIQVFAINTTEADKMLEKLYMITSNYQNVDINPNDLISGLETLKTE
ncbi:uncharacterized protein LOC108108671 [Drosophila eugracilis]|uniref:uncharacterized protein LOC108108671 n=1 Tax=Drosophila eugracilis TaxID=29029 RepID=UPI0007E7F9D0|nr:uncharacterized protein LOC108108671 [Drosophila eugracilis]